MANVRMKLFCDIIISVFFSFIHLNQAERYNVHRNQINVSHSHEIIYSGAFLPEDDPPQGIVFIFGTFGLAVLIKYVFGLLKLKIPPTTMIFVIGGFIGWMSHISEEVHDYVHNICHMTPKYMLMILLPVLVFRPSYKIDAHLFKKSIKQIILFSTVGFVVSTTMMALMLFIVFDKKWNFMVALMFGIISSTCYSEYTVSILQDIGQSKYLSIIMEGETLLTDVSAIALFNMLIGYLIGYIADALTIFVICLTIFIASPLFGFIVGKITVCILNITSHDPIGSATITIVVAYISFYVTETLLRGCGVLCVVVLGIVISAERLNIHSDLDTFLQQFWDLLYFYANSFIFILVGVMIFEIFARRVTMIMILMSPIVYAMSFMCRVVMYSLMNVSVKWCKYQVSWKHVSVAVWGNFRGPVSLCLALVASKIEGLEEEVGAEFLTYTTVLVLMTHIIQGSTLYFVMKLLGMTEISEARLANMNAAMKYFYITRERSINMIKMDRHLSDSNWLIVEEATRIKHPYKIDIEKLENGVDLFLGLRMVLCPDCEKEFLADPTTKEYREMQKEAYLRILKARKVSYRNQYEHGVLSNTAVHLLVTAVDIAFHRTVPIMELRDLKTRWTLRKITDRVRKFVVKLLWRYNVGSPPQNKCRMKCYIIVVSRWFECLMCVVVLIYTIPVLLEIYFLPEKGTGFTVLAAIDSFFFSVFTIEFGLKISAFGGKKYFRDPYNSLDFIILITSFVNIVYYIRQASVDFLNEHKELSSGIMLSTTNAFKILRLVRLIRLLRLVLPQSLVLLDTIVESHVTLNFEVGRGYIVGEEEILKILPHIIDNKKIYLEIKQKLEIDRLNIAKKLSYIEKEYPKITTSIKTRQAIRIVLNNIGDAVNELKNRGVLDDFEYLSCKRMVDKRVKYLQNHFKKMEACPPHILMNEVPWIGKRSDVASFLLERTQPVTFSVNEIIISRGSIPEALYIILYGVVKVVYVPTKETLLNLKLYGALPNVDYFITLNFEERQEEYIVGGNVIGELGILTGRPYDVTAKCETSVQAFRLTSHDLLQAMNMHSEKNVGLRAQMWKSVAIRVANVILTNTPHYQACTPEEIKYNLERSYVPNLPQDTTFTVSDLTEDVLLIEGQVMDAYTRNIYFAPCYLPRSSQKLYFPGCESVHIQTDIETKLLIIPILVYDRGMQEGGTNMPYSQSFSTRCLQHSILKASSRNLLRDVKRRSRKHSKKTLSPKSQISTPNTDISGKESRELIISGRDSGHSAAEEIQNLLLHDEGAHTSKTFAFVDKEEERKTRFSVGVRDEEDERRSLSPKISTPNQSPEISTNLLMESQQNTTRETVHPEEDAESEESKTKEEKNKDKEME